MNNLRILLDVDGPLADWHQYFFNLSNRLIRDFTPTGVTQSITQSRIIDLFSEDGLKRIRKVHQIGWPIGQYSTANFFKSHDHMWEFMGCPFLDLDSTEESEMIVQLVESHDPEFHFCTDPGPHEDAPSDKTKWLRQYFGNQSRIHITASKSDLAKPTTLLIDDYHENCIKFTQAGGWAICYPTFWTTSLNSSQRIRAISRMLTLVLMDMIKYEGVSQLDPVHRMFHLNHTRFREDRTLKSLVEYSQNSINDSLKKHSDVQEQT